MVRRDLLKALQRLPVPFRTAVMLIEIEGLSYAEAAEALDWPIGTVRSRVHRGRRALRTALRPDADAA
jgi:RNA polymerase sigma-70 factor, ECF subfamily